MPIPSGPSAGACSVVRAGWPLGVEIDDRGRGVAVATWGYACVRDVVAPGCYAPHTVGWASRRQEGT
jgi:hypothetical protein